ncbi:MAG: tetratricopeptide repeat protein [Bryobacteraceae bacterium]
MRWIIFGLLCAGSAAAQTADLDSNKALFAVMAAINMAGHDAGLDSPSAHPLRKAIREEIAKRKPAVAPDIREFFVRHRQEDAQWELRLYTSYALLTDGPPKFGWRLQPYQIPPDVGALEDFSKLMAKFYEQAGIEELWEKSQPVLDKEVERYSEKARQAITEVSGYLRAPLGGTFMGRRFHVVVDLLGAPNQILALAFLDDYYLVSTSSPDIHTADIERQYMRYLLDPLFTKWGDKVDEKRALGDYALGAPHLADHYKQDFLLLTTTCLIRAVEARMAPEARRAAMVDQAMKEGFILTAHFAEQLPLYEKQEQAMSLYFPELIKSIDFKKEEKRMEAFEFSEKRVTRKVVTPSRVAEPERSETDIQLDAAEDLYRKRDFEAASEAFTRLVGAGQPNPVRAKAYYGLARIAALRNDPETAQKTFTRVLELDPPAVEKAWTLVYLGKLSTAAARARAEQGQETEAADELFVAAQHFEAALRVEGASAKAREEAEKSLQALPKAPKQ